MQSQPKISSPPMATIQTLPKFSRYRSVRKATANRQYPSNPSVLPSPSKSELQPNSFAAAQNNADEQSIASLDRTKSATKITGSESQLNIPSTPDRPRTQKPHEVDVKGEYKSSGLDLGVDQPGSRKENVSSSSGNEGRVATGTGAGSNDGIETALSKRGAQNDGGFKESVNRSEKPRKEVFKNKLTGGAGSGRPQIADTTRKLAKSQKSNLPEGPPVKSSDPRRSEGDKESEASRNMEQSDNGVQSMANASKRLSWKGIMGISRTKVPNPEEGSQNQIHMQDEMITTSDGTGSAKEGTITGVDAPVSAVNAGARKVLVKCNAASIKLPVLPTTHAQELIYSAANCLSEPIDIKKSVLLESFSSLGLERPLRRYEHVRNVLNSWANDTQNSLIITQPPVDSDVDKLDVKIVPDEQPGETTFHLYHSQRPGKWDKRYITLRTDGQVVVSKKSRQEPTNICHLSDFDIYSPTQHQLSKKIKPPKKFCFAIKSQQKSSMFLSTENFVHFFATNDRNLARNWYDAVHTWRSWYLVHVLGEGQHRNDKSAQASAGVSEDASPSAASQHRRNFSTGSTPYQLGSFKPLLNIDSFCEDQDNSDSLTQPNPAEASGTNSKDIYARKKPVRGRGPPPTSFPKRLAESEIAPQSDDDGHGDTPTEKSDAAPFAPTGLLGRTYSERQQAQREREERFARSNTSDTGIFSHGLLGNSSSNAAQQSPQSHSNDSPNHQCSRANTVRSTHAGDLTGLSLARSNSSRQKPKPLIDLTPVYQEPPQHSRKGHGVKVQPGVPLVDVATSPELSPGAILVPSASTWRRPDPQMTSTVSNDPPLALSASSSIRMRSNTIRSQHRGLQYPTDSGSPLSPENPFAPSGLLARSKATGASPGTGLGRGVVTGDRRADKPLLDLTARSQFASGSLLQRIEHLKIPEDGH